MVQVRLRIALLLLLVVVLVGADRPPWRARRRPGIRHNRMASLRVLTQDWPQEPQSPGSVDKDRLAKALNALCGWMPPARPRKYAEWILAAASEFGEDPFLLGGLVFRESRCRPRKEELGGLGLTLLAPNMYRHGFRSRHYAFRVKQDGQWQERKRAMKRFPFTQRWLLSAESNLYFAAALLSVWREQHDTVDAVFEQVPHRHYVSHWVWGDRVTSARAEDRIFTDRRRLLQYYGAIEPAAALSREGLALGSPLDGPPRVVSSAMGSHRAGDRPHRGVDIESVFGEPVRAIADGRVVFAGVDLPGRRHNQIMAPEEINTFNRRAMGRGGRYLCLLHPRPGSAGLRSCYMHLETVDVAAGTEVRRGDLIGTVGRTGMLRSAPHLHLELHGENQLLDPLHVLRGHLIGRPQDAPKPKKRRRRRAVPSDGQPGQ